MNVLRRSDKPTPRFHREAWLQAAMQALAKEGQAELRVDAHASQLGVTKGSFYHHFKNREEFVQSLLAYWSSAFTDNAIAEVRALEGSPEERLLKLMQIIEREGLDRYDIAFRSWAAQDSSVAKGVRKVDLARYRFIRSLFAEMGFEGTDLEDRVRIWLVFQSAHHTVYSPKRLGNGKDAIIRRHAFFTQPRSSAEDARQKLSRKRH